MPEPMEDRAADCLHRVHEFRMWIETNAMFPLIPDRIVRPLRNELCEIEKQLVAILYERNAIDRVAPILTLSIKP